MHFNQRLLMETLARLPDLIADYFRNIPDADLDLYRTPDAWSIREHLYHIVSVQDMLLGRMQVIKATAGATITPYFPQNQPDRNKLYPSIDAAFHHYRSSRLAQMALLSGLNSQEWEHEAEHPEYRQYNIPLLVNHMIFHENWHLYRIEELWLTRDGFLA